MNPVVLISGEERLLAEQMRGVMLPVRLTYGCKVSCAKARTDHTAGVQYITSDESDVSDEKSSCARTKWWRWHRMGTLQNGGEVFHSIRSRDNRMQLVEPYEPSSCKRHWRSPLTVTKGQHKVTQHSEVTNLKKEPSIKDVYPQVKVEVSAYVAPLPESNKKESINEGKMKHTAVIEDEVEDSPKFFCSRTSAWQFRKSDESSSAEPYVFISSSDITAAKKVLGSSKSPAKEKPASLSKLSSILPTGSQLNTQSTNHQLASLKLRKFGIELCKINENFRTSTLLHESDSAFKPSDIVPVSPSVPDKSLDWSETINPIHCSSTEDGVNSEVETHGLAWMNTPTALRDKVKIERTAATDHSSSKPLLSYADLLTTYVEDGVQRKLGRHVSSENSESTEDHSQTADALPEIFSDDNNSCDFHNPCIRQVEPEIPLNSESKTNEITEMKKSDIVENHLQIADVYSLSNAPWNNSVTKPDEISGPDVSIKEASLKQGKVLLGIVTSFQLPNEDVLPSQPNQENVPLTDAQPLQPTISANAITVKKESEEIPSEIPFNSCKVLNHDAVTDVPHPSSSLVPCASPVDNSNPKLTVHNFPATFQQVPANPIEPAAKHCNLPLLTSNESSSHPLHVIDGHIAPGSVIRPNNTPSQQLPGKTISASNGTLESGDEGRKCSSADMNINDSHSSIMHSDVQTVKTTALTGAAILQAVSLRQESGLHSNAQFSANQSIMISRTHHLSETVHHFDANSLGRKNDTYNHELANQYSIPGNINQHLESSAAPVQRNSAVYPTVSQVPPPSYDDTTRTSRNNEYQRMIIKLTNPHAGPVSNTVQPTATFKDQLQTPYYADTSRIHNTSQANATVYSQPSCAQTVPFSSVHTSSSRLQVSSSEIPSSCGVRVWQGNVIGSESVISLPPRSVTPLILKRKQSGFEIESQRVGSLPGAPHVASYTIQKSVSQTTAFNGDSASQINTSSRVEPEQNSSTIRKVNTEYLRKHFQKYQKYPDYLQYLRNFFCHPVSVSYPQQTSKTISSSVLVSKNCSGVDHNFAQTPRTTVLVGPSNTSVNTASGWSPRPASTELHSNNKHVNQESVSPPHISSPKLSESQLVKDTQPVITNQSTMPSGESLPITWHKRSSTDDSCREVNKRGKYMQLKASERMNVTALNVLEGDALPCLKQQSGILLAGASSAPGQVAGVNFTPLQTSTTTCSEAQQASTVVQSAPLLSSASSYATQPEASTIPHSKTFQTTNQKETSTTSSASQQTVVSSAKHVQILNTICTEPLQNSAKQDIVQQQIVSESDCAPQQSTDSQPNDGSESLLVCVSCKVTYNSLAHFNHHMEVSHGQTEKQQREMCDRVKSSNVPTSTGPVVGPVTLSTTGSFGDNSLASHETNVGIDSGVPFLESDKSPDSDSDEDLKSYLY